MCGGYIIILRLRELGLEEQKKLGVCLCVISNLNYTTTWYEYELHQQYSTHSLHIQCVVCVWLNIRVYIILVQLYYRYH